MKKYLFLALALSTAYSNTYASRFECESDSDDLHVRINVRGNPTEKSSFVIILSNPNLDEGSKTIARLSDSGVEFGDGNYEKYIAFVDPENVSKNKKILGAKMGDVTRVTFTYYTDDGVAGLSVLLWNGRYLSTQLTCKTNF